MTLKILHILHSLQVGGLENGVVNLINRLDPVRFQHAICCIDASGPMAERIQCPTDIHEIGKGGQRDYLLPFRIARVIRRVRPDIVHTRNWGTIDGVIAAKLAGVKHLVHGEHGREATDPSGANKRRKQFRKLISPFISRFVTVSDDLGKWLINDVGVPSNKVVQIINGVDTVRFAPEIVSPSAREREGLSPDAFVIGTVGRLDPVKDQQLLIRAFALLKRCNTVQAQRLKLLIVGAGPERDRLTQLVAELGVGDAVLMPGERRDVPDQMRNMDLFVLPSIAEGISNTILEAMASGLPVLATSVGGSGELIEDGVSGYLFPTGDVERLAALITQCLNNRELSRSLGSTARRRCEEHFSLKAMAAAYARMYEDVMVVS